MKSLVLHAWIVYKFDKTYSLPYTHWIYLNEITKYYEKIDLLAVCRHVSETELHPLTINQFKNVVVYELPFSKNYLSAVPYFFNYLIAYYRLRKAFAFYARYPVPFGWLQKLFSSKAIRIIHYVGDPVDVTLNNPNFSKAKKKVLISLFSLENKLYHWACKGAKVFTNGHHLSKKLAKSNINSTPLISSTLDFSDFYFDKDKKIDLSNFKLVYLGYLRKTKGVDTVLKAFSLLLKDYPSSSFTIIGSGEFESNLMHICKSENITNVTFAGHLDDRQKINQVLRNHDVFLFGSHSEGSPRAVLEAMANGLLVISTPVGSLPKIFTHKKDILFADFNDEKSFYSCIKDVLDQPQLYAEIRAAAHDKVKEFTLERFLKTIFDES